MNMKKTLLITLLVLATTINAQRVWVVGDDATNFPVSAGIGAGPDKSVFITDLGIHTGTVTNVNMGQVEAASKAFGTVTYPNRFKFNGGGYPAAADTQTTPSSGDPAVNYFLPTQRFLTMQVDGPGTIKIQAVTGSSGSTRRLFITNGVSLIGTMVFPAGSTISEETVEYTGEKAVLYLYCNAAINIYKIEATSAVTHSALPLAGIHNVLSNNGVSFNGFQILNSKNLNVEVFNILGKLVTTSKSDINTKDFSKGVYVVRADGVNGAMKISVQ